MKKTNRTPVHAYGIVALIYSIVLVGLLPWPSHAHAPHDVVDSLAISPNYHHDSTIYSIVRNNLLKSNNNGRNWKRLVNGFDGSSGLVSVAIDPSSPTILYAASLVDGLYKSENAGNSWHRVNQGLKTPFIRKVFIPSSSSHALVFAVDNGQGLSRTLDGGANWFNIYTNPTPISALNGYSCNLPENCRILMGDQAGKLSLSSDGGLTWNKIFERPECGAINTIGVSPRKLVINTYFMGTEKCGIFQTINGGQTFLQVNNGIVDMDIRSVAMSPTFDKDKTVFASTWHDAIYVSANAGKVWTKYSEGLTTDKQADQAHLPDFRDIRLSPNFKDDKTVFLAGFNGLFRSINGGLLWKEMVTLPSNLIQSVSLSPAYHSDKTLAITTYAGGIYLSTDDGVSWQSTATEILKGRNYDIAFSPAYALDQTIFASTGAVGKSIDRGHSWSAYAVPSKHGPNIFAISPSFAKDQTLFVSTRFGDINRSTDGGKSYQWIFKESLNDKCRDTCLSALVVSPSYSTDHLLLVATKTHGIQISTDGGETWISRVPVGVLGNEIRLAFSPNYQADHAIFIGSNKGLFLSTDELTSLQKLSTPSSGIEGQVKELAISPDFANDKTMLMTVKGKGLFRSLNGGKTFQQIAFLKFRNNNEFSLYSGFPAASSSSIRFSPAYAVDKTIYATSSDKLFRSRDGGNTWAFVLNNLALKN